MLLSDFKKNLILGVAIVLGSLVLFLVQQFFLGLTGLVNLPLVAVIFFSLKKSPLAWPLAAFNGWLLDAVLGTAFFHLVVFLSLVLLISYFTQTVALENYFARWLLISGSLAVGLLVGYLIIFLTSAVGLNFYRFLFSLSAAGLIGYLAVNSLIIFFSMLIANQLTHQTYARFS
ncbi:MAG: hypothetical protein NTZ18_01670 [Candidatus Komeilibacteria bacterium]|nr:hypothetical protein [Candidatus Komeilibacteria bacterium]